MSSGILGLPSVLQVLRATALSVVGKTGATAGAGLAGGTTSGAPTTGTFNAGDAVVDQTGVLWICTVTGTPGTWAAVPASLDASKITTGTLAQARGGTGKDTSAATDGQLLIGKTSDHSLNLATLTAGSGVTITNGAGAVTVAASGGATLSTASSFLSADVTSNSANVYVDGPSVSLAAGTWFVVAQVQIQFIDLSDLPTVKLWNGTTVIASQDMPRAANNLSTVTLCGIASPGSTQTWKVSVATTGGSGGVIMKAHPLNNSPGNFATGITAVKVG